MQSTCIFICKLHVWYSRASIFSNSVDLHVYMNDCLLVVVFSNSVDLHVHVYMNDCLLVVVHKYDCVMYTSMIHGNNFNYKSDDAYM